MKGFLLLGALCVLSLAFLVEEASPQSTTAPSSTVTTENPTSPSSTVTTENPTSPSSTVTTENSAAPSVTIATENPTSPSVTITTEDSTAPSTPDSTINSTAPATEVTPNKDTSTSTNPPVSNKCNDTSCGGDAVCVPLFDSIACQCPVRFFYEDQSCKEGGSVLGKLIIQDRIFDQDTESEAYTALYQEIQNFFTKSLGQQYNGTYVETVIENITAVSSTSRALTTVVTALVTNMFNTLSINLTEINEFILNKVAGETFSYSSRSICEVASCDLKTTACIETQNGQNTDCSCLGGHYRESNTACKNCNDHCAAKTNQQCVWSTQTSEEKCQCLPGYTTNKDGGSCKEYVTLQMPGLQFVSFGLNFGIPFEFSAVLSLQSNLHYF
ncbi:mucin-13 [Pelobates cultripes]|uniref:Mucin-13 n=1 Tax=Pelobates cultripes TaxID=61616 RepID=A0AAD1WG47_PELCU|nr:mucin-13 [Pelobates cultripes]